MKALLIVALFLAQLVLASANAAEQPLVCGEEDNQYCVANAAKDLVFFAEEQSARLLINGKIVPLKRTSTRIVRKTVPEGLAGQTRRSVYAGAGVRVVTTDVIKDQSCLVKDEKARKWTDSGSCCGQSVFANVAVRVAGKTRNLRSEIWFGG